MNHLNITQKQQERRKKWHNAVPYGVMALLLLAIVAGLAFVQPQDSARQSIEAGVYFPSILF